MARSKLCSSITATSDLRKCRNDGYSIHQTSVGDRCCAAAAMNAVAPVHHIIGKAEIEFAQKSLPCRIHTLGWYKKPSVALINSHIRIFWNNPSSHRLVNVASTFATTVSSTSNSHQISVTIG